MPPPGLLLMARFDIAPAGSGRDAINIDLALLFITRLDVAPARSSSYTIYVNLALFVARLDVAPARSSSDTINVDLALFVARLDIAPARSSSDTIYVNLALGDGITVPDFPTHAVEIGFPDVSSLEMDGLAVNCDIHSAFTVAANQVLLGFQYSR